MYNTLFPFFVQLKNSQTLIQKGTDTFQENTEEKKKKKGLSSQCFHFNFKHRFLNQQAKQVST